MKPKYSKKKFKKKNTQEIAAAYAVLRIVMTQKYDQSMQYYLRFMTDTTSSFPYHNNNHSNMIIIYYNIILDTCFLLLAETLSKRLVDTRKIF